jgi:hypothetical protein
MKLGAAKYPYFNSGLYEMKFTGTYYYYSSRNFNFANNHQKGVIIVE